MSRSDISDWQRHAVRRLRRDMTPAEYTLWHILRAHRFRGLAFRRQAPVGPYIVDFVCHDAKLVIEIDGGQHAGCARDKRRDGWLRQEGFRVVRFWNNDVLGNLAGVLEVIAREAASDPPPHPSPTRGEGAPAAQGGDVAPGVSTAAGRKHRRAP